MSILFRPPKVERGTYGFRFKSREDAEFMAEVLCQRYGSLFEAKSIGGFDQAHGNPGWGVINTTTQAFMWLDAKARFPLPMK